MKTDFFVTSLTHYYFGLQNSLRFITDFSRLFVISTSRTGDEMKFLQGLQLRRENIDNTGIHLLIQEWLYRIFFPTQHWGNKYYQTLFISEVLCLFSADDQRLFVYRCIHACVCKWPCALHAWMSGFIARMWVCLKR